MIWTAHRKISEGASTSRAWPKGFWPASTGDPREPRMTTVTCVLHEAVVLREHGICLQLVGLDPERAQVAVADLPAREGADDAATRRLRRCKERLKGRMHAAAEALQALHVQLE